MKILSYKFTFFLISLLGLSVAFLGYFVLPEKFFFDTNIIIKDRHNEIGLVGSYPFSIWFYTVTRLKHLNFSIIGGLQYIIAIWILYKIGIPKRFNKLTVKNCLIYLSFLMLAIFICMPTKEFINFLYVAIIVFLFQRRKRKLSRTVIIGLGLILLFGYFFRPYYIIALILCISMHFISFVKIRNKNVFAVFYSLLILIGISLSYGVVKGEFLSASTRERVNERRIRAGDPNANSLIVSPIKTDTWIGESVGVFYGFFSVNLPINGLKHFLSPQILAFIMWQLFLFVILFMNFGRSFSEGRKGNYDIWLFYFLFSYFIIQGVFEPDLGSAVRHKIGVFPLIYYLMYYEEFRKKIS